MWTTAGLIVLVLAFAIVITILMRPDIFLTILRGGRDTTPRKAPPKAVSDAEFQERLRKNVE